MFKRLVNSRKNKGRPRSKAGAKYLTAMALGLAVGWPFAGLAQEEPDLLENLEALMAPLAPAPDGEPPASGAGPAQESRPPVNPPPARPGYASGRGDAGELIVPPPPWYRANNNPLAGQPILPGPQPEFGSSLGAWRELNIGQAESPSFPDDEQPTAPGRLDPEDGAAGPQRSPGRQRLKNLFDDLFVSETDQPGPTAAPESVPEKPAGPAAPGQKRAGAPAELAGQARIISAGRPGAWTRPPDSKPQTPALAPAGGKLTPAKPGSSPAGGRGGPAAAPKRSGPPPGRPGLAKPHLVLINETGRPETAREYQRVLGAMGYQVISVHERAPQKGATFISYRPGQKAQALELSQRLPGRRISLEAQSEECLPTEITIYIR